MNRKTFILSIGATCSNWIWSWSFVNHKDKEVIFGMWSKFGNDKNENLILSDNWQYRNGRKSSGYKQAIQHIALIQQNKYKLRIFLQEGNTHSLPAKIVKIHPILYNKTLSIVTQSNTGNDYYAQEICIG